ncbi:hypothetical protein BGW38_008902 [Lunasporangiospora selenospora]|uniref:Coiled-coil domain-containing protein 43 n=1 Tax=Lunasporangiospora selenospora TaxID=979761 RepID=A0A9P6FXJ3_9FUNG|nr:hypothetical protein BGW38_008902 [Lunasporangiospora selenospora]
MDMDSNPEIEAFITERLASISLQDEAITQFFASIVGEETMEEPEKREAITELLVEATSEPTVTIIDSVFEFYNKLKQEEAKKAQEEKDRAVEAAKKKVQDAFKLVDVDRDAYSLSSRHVIKEMSKDERKRRDALLAQYGYELDDVVEGEDGETEIMYKDRSGRSKAGPRGMSSDPLLAANTNADIVKQRDAKRRSDMQQASENEKERNRLALEKQRLAKEKEGRRTQKQEKRRM